MFQAGVASRHGLGAEELDCVNGRHRVLSCYNNWLCLIRAHRCEHVRKGNTTERHGWFTAEGLVRIESCTSIRILVARLLRVYYVCFGLLAEEGQGAGGRHPSFAMEQTQTHGTDTLLYAMRMMEERGRHLRQTVFVDWSASRH